MWNKPGIVRCSWATMTLLGSMAAILATGQLTTFAQDQKPKPAPKSTRPASQPARPQPHQQHLQNLERDFAGMMRGAVLVGSWQMTSADGLEGKAPLGAPGEERYEISEARKLADDRWLIGARIRYADKDVTLPVPVRIVWAEDTPVITVDNLSVPGIGTYSARVMFFGRFYAGIWRGKNYGGVMSGQIVPTPDKATTQPAEVGGAEQQDESQRGRSKR